MAMFGRRKDDVTTVQETDSNAVAEWLKDAKYSEILALAKAVDFVTKQYGHVKLGDMEPKDWVSILHSSAEYYLAEQERAKTKENTDVNKFGIGNGSINTQEYRVSPYSTVSAVDVSKYSPPSLLTEKE